jgi:L-threonylcarbamoyladenylate synthase
MTIVVPATTEGLRESGQILRRGGLVAFPTETVYGLGADAQNAAAVQAMFAAKGRPADHPVIVHLPDASHLEQWTTRMPQAAQRLAAAFWPGPLTMIVPRSARASDLVTGGLETVGLRVPGHPVARQLLRQFGGAIAAPSANRFGRVSPTTAAHVLEELAGRIDLILDGGACPVGLESTIVDLASDRPRVLRPGAITQEQLAGVIGAELAQTPTGPERVSGGLASHYAPRARVEIVPAAELCARESSLVASGLKVAVLDGTSAKGEALAQRLYGFLRQADADGCDVILASLPALDGIGAAIADRLRKAAGPRDAN